MKEKMICRGDLFYYDFGDNSGSVQSEERPVLVIQADDYNQNAPTIIVAAVTSVLKKRYLPSHIILGEEFGPVSYTHLDVYKRQGEKSTYADALWIDTVLPISQIERYIEKSGVAEPSNISFVGDSDECGKYKVCLLYTYRCV